MKKIYVILIVGLFISCGKFLEPKSPSEFIPKNINSLNEMLTFGAYYRPGVGNVDYFTMLELFSDDLQMTTNAAYFDGLNAPLEFATKRIVAMTGDMFEEMASLEGVGVTAWECFYQSILKCNAAMDYMPTVSGTKEEKAYVEAQALFMRALGYFYLVNYYGEPYNHNKKALAVPLKLTSNLAVDMVKRNSVEEVYQQIIKDLLRAEECWALNPEKQFRKDFRANLPATQFLLAKVYLFMENWKEAKKYAEKVMAWSDFSLYNLNLHVNSKNTNLNYALYENSETIWLYGNIIDYTKITNTSLKMKMNDPTNPNESSRNRKKFIASSSLLESYEDEGTTGDLRKRYYIFTEWVTDAGKAGFIETKLAVGKIFNDGTMSPVSGHYNPALKFRLSEMYLTYAEACAMIGGEENNALSAMNTLRENRILTVNYVPVTGITGSELIEYIRAERRRELCFEGSRWFDMRRWGMKSFKREWRRYGVVENVYTIADNDPAFTFPIPRAVLDFNTALVQNPLSSRTIND